MLQLFSLFDNKSGTHGNPFIYLDTQQAKANVRRFVNAEANKDINPADYELYHLGSFDADTGKITPHEAPKHLYSCRTLINVTSPMQDDMDNLKSMAESSK